MKVDRYQIQFEGGLVDGERFVGLKNDYYNNPATLVSDLKSVGIKNKDINGFFASPIENSSDGTITWIIEQETDLTFEFKRLEDINPSLQHEIMQRHIAVFSELDEVRQRILSGFEQNFDQNRKLLETLDILVSSREDVYLFAGYSPDNAMYFPVIVGWGGEKKDKLDRDTTLRTAKGSELGETTSGGDAAETSASGVVSERPITDNYQSLNWLWVLWVLIFLMILMIAYIVLPSCGVRGIFNTCESPTDPIGIMQFEKQLLIEEVTLKQNICIKKEYSEKSNIIEKKALETLPTDQNPPDIDTQLNDKETERRIGRDEGKKSNLMATLIWNTKEDLDIKITCPNGGYVNHSKRMVETNNCGTLDIDANVISAKEKIKSDPIENVLLSPMKGTYKLEVKSVPNENSVKNGTPFNISIVDFGNIKQFRGSIKPKELKSFIYERQ